MAGVGAAINTVISDRWAFEALGHDLGVPQSACAWRFAARSAAAPGVRHAGRHAKRHYWL
jgi:hypothetical protein